MNRKFLSVFFSALVCSTLGHEHLKAHELQRSHHARSQHLGSHNARSHQQQCSYVCPVPQPSPEVNNPALSLSLVFIEETKVFALVNTTLEVAIVFQIGEPIALIANGQTGVSIVINIDKQTVVYYSAGCNGNLWKESQSNLVDYLQNLGPLTNVNNWQNGQSFKLSSVSKEVKTILISIVQYLDIEIAIRVQTNPDAVVSLISVLVNSLLQSSDVVELLLTQLESSVTVIIGGLSKVVNLIVGLKSIGTQLQGGLQSVLRDINVSLLLGENSGLSSLLNLLIQVGVHLDLTKILGDVLQSPDKLLGLAVTLDGGIYVGISGITAVIYNVQLYAAKRISLDALIDIILQVEAANGHVKITKEIWNSVINWYFVLSQSQASQFNTGSSWSTTNKFFQDIKNENLVINGINVSAIINVLISTSGNISLSNVVRVLVNLRPVCALNRIIATLYFRLVYFVISGEGLIFIGRLLPDITITINLSSTTSILKQILSSVNVLQILSYLLRLDIVGAITHIPILGPILKALDDILNVVGLAAEVTVTSALKAVGSILDDLKNILLFGLGRGGKALTDTGIAGLSSLGGGLSVSINASWSSSENWSYSSGGSLSSSGSTSQSRVTTVASSSSIGGSSPYVSSSASHGTSVSGPSSTEGGITIGGGSSSTGRSSSRGSSTSSGGISVGGGSSSTRGSSSRGSSTSSGGISVGGGSSSTSRSSSGGSSTSSGGISVGGVSSSSGGGSSGGSNSEWIHIGGGTGGSGGSGGSGGGSGIISVGGSSSNGGSSWGGSGADSGGLSIGGSASSGGHGSGSSSGGSGSQSGGTSVGGSASSSGGGSAGGSSSHSGGGSASQSSGNNKGSGGWSLGSLFG